MSKSSDSSEVSTLNDVCDRLDVLIALFLPPSIKNTDILKGLALEIFKLCDYEHTTDEIRIAVGKSSNHVLKELSLLRSKGRIRTVRRGAKQVHVRMQ